ncbi:Alpha-ribazole-5'-phosphate phosphatase [Desulfosporosinus sp. I2]|uniref:alpha-ribazole phosphatase n=1 Tax=Desulfosporosinus sp. I2 TaxID=1617025 RepID=UPI0005EEF5A8|nr:alpha-ribazole phosphatase [Desulfosporosinus sp. I2]KJR46561.1 Alpha-ribazole-5'-phosphate phosphatase [Desulfosporosinus sp. I2]
MAKKLIYLVRHGDIGQGKDKCYIGQLDIPLSELGKKQASLLKEIFSRVPLDNIYCSDIGRVQQTADLIASAHQIVPMARVELRELYMGDWEGKPFSEIRTNYPKEFKERGADIVNYRPPLGESFSDCYKRVIPVFESLAKSDEPTILIVGHAGVNRVILCHVLGIPLENVFRFEQSYGCVNLICKEGFEYRLKYLNYTVNRDLSSMGL